STVASGLLAAANPAGTQFVLFEGPGLIFIDTQFNVLGQIPLNVASPQAQQPTGLVYSPDGTRLYMVTPGPVAIITTIDATNFTILGTAPGYSNGSPVVLSTVENPLAADGTGLVIGSAVGGLVFDDSTDFQTLSNPTIISDGGLITPSEGPVPGGTVTTVTWASTGVPDQWFGSQLAATENLSDPELQATSPPATAAGVVNVKIIDSAGLMTMFPQSFTYGSVPLLTAPLASAPGGNVGADIYGFGFSVDTAGATQEITIGTGSAKTIRGTQLQGFPVQDLTLNVPAGSPGLVDIVVKSPTGTATYPKGFRYLTSVTDYSSSDTFSAVLYDSTRQQLYLNAGDHIDIFSLTSNSFGTPITPPSLSGPRQLQGMALTPDGSELIVGNFSDDSVSIINPDNPTTAKVVQIAPPIGPDALPEGPHAVATTSKGTVFIDIGTTSVLSGGGGMIYELNLTTLIATPRNDLPFSVQVAGEPMSQSGDGTKVFITTPNDSGGYVMMWSATTDSWQAHNIGGVYELFFNDVAAARDGNVFAINNAGDSYFAFPMFFDPQLNQTSQLGIESLFAAVNQPGMAVHDSGALLYSSTDLGVDIIDVRHGGLAERILLNEQDTFLSDSLAIDDPGQKIFLITSAGLTIIDLDAVPLSIGSMTPSSGSSGTVVQVRGSGFQSGTTVAFNGTPAAVKLTDADTMQVTVPTITSGPAQIVLSNPDGTSYKLDDAFTVQ
ncbi:MAG: IPT/TIG domain-containing protein, partial [Candidatus Acidiferrales bacterium]